MGKSTSIYSKQNPKIREIFERAGNSQKVLAAAIDYAKAKHTVLFCNGVGDILKPPFAVENSIQGLEALLQEVQKTCRHRGIPAGQVFFGGEDRPSYAENFIGQICKSGYLVVRVNAWEAKRQRDNHQASTDELDVLGIAKAMLQQASYADDQAASKYRDLREISRARSYLVGEQTAIKLHMHTYVDRLFPNFLNATKSGLAPFSAASLALMTDGLNGELIRRKSLSSLVKKLARYGLDDPGAAAERLHRLAQAALPPDPDHVSTWQTSLKQYASVYQQINQSILALDKELAHWLAMTPGALLTSIRGVGVVLAAGIVGELGDPAQWRGLRQISSYAGIVPGVQQSGGPDKPAYTTGVKRRCNRRAKNWIVQAASHMGQHGPSPLQEQFLELVARGQHAEFVMGKRLLRIAKDLMRRGTVYRPKELLHPNTSPQQLAEYFIELWPSLIDKWSGLVVWDHLFDTRFPLGQWRQMAQELYKISLPLPRAPGRFNHAGN